MQLALANIRPQDSIHDGGSVHVYQFTKALLALGHTVWVWPKVNSPIARHLPNDEKEAIDVLRQVDAIYTRVEWKPPKALLLSGKSYRERIPHPLRVWEFNAVPEFGRLEGASDAEIRAAIVAFRSAAHRCDLAICGSQTAARYLGQKLKLPRVVIVPNGSDPDFFTPDATPMEEVRQLSSRLDVAFIGSMNVGWHNLSLLRDAAKLLHENPAGRSIHFHLIGIPSPAVHDMPPNIRYHGVVPHHDMDRWLASMDVGLCLYTPGLGDFSSPMKMFDYMAAGLAVVSTPQPHAAHVLAEINQNDQVVPHDNPRAMADLLAAMASDKPRVKSLGLAGRQRVVDYYNWDRAAREVIAAIESTTPACRTP